MADDVNRDPDARGRCPPYFSPVITAPRFMNAPHLSLLLVNADHLGALLPGEERVTSPPVTSPLYDWLVTGDPEAYCGPLVISWVFFRHMSLRDNLGRHTYAPRFFARVISQGGDPFIIQMTSEWFERANETMALAACGRTVHHLPTEEVQSFLHYRGHRASPITPEWSFELLTMEVVLHPHCLRASRSLLGGALVQTGHRQVARRDGKKTDFGPPPSPDLGGR